MATNKRKLTAPKRGGGRPRETNSALMRELSRVGVVGVAARDLVVMRLLVEPVTAYEYLGGKPILETQAFAFLSDIGTNGVARVVDEQGAGIVADLLAERRGVVVVRGMALRSNRHRLAARVEGLAAKVDAEHLAGVEGDSTWRS